MKFKNLPAIILSLALILTLTACGNGGGSSSPFSSASVGDVIQFGAFDWRVLDVQDGMALVISEDILESQRYHADSAEITWEHSSIREYLNGEFYNSFSSAEQEQIVETTIINNNNPSQDTPGGNDTTDNIFLLSIDEVQTYFADDSARIALDSDGTAWWWWLRSPGSDRGSAAAVHSNGYVLVYGYCVYDGNGYLLGGIRPALWLNL
jgi:hypothetical protein